MTCNFDRLGIKIQSSLVVFDLGTIYARVWEFASKDLESLSPLYIQVG